MSRRIYLMRHFKAERSSADGKDFSRQLSPRGKKAGVMVCRHLLDNDYSPEAVLASPAVRTRQSLELIAPACTHAQISFEDGMYLAPAKHLFGYIQNLDDDLNSVLLVGHSPGIADLAADLADPDQGDRLALGDLCAKYPTGALTVLDFDVHEWNEVEPGEGILRAFIRPAQLVV